MTYYFLFPHRNHFRPPLSNATEINTIHTAGVADHMRLTRGIVPVQRWHIICAGEVQSCSCDLHHVLIAGPTLQAVEALATIACVFHLSSRLSRT